MLTDQLGVRKRVFAVVLLAVAPLTAMPVEVTSPGDTAELERKYLACDREATTRRLSSSEAHVCSLVAEALLQRGFGGDSERLLAWWRSSRQSTSPVSGT